MKKRRSGISIMAKLIGLIKPLWAVMLLAITLGVVGYSCAVFLTILATHGLLTAVNNPSANLGGLFAALVVMAVSRGLLHYGEQYCNHFIAFRLLAIIRHKIFAKLRTLAPAKLEGKDKGNLISVITTDTELLEVFYAHTISPIAIAVIMSVIMTVFIGVNYLPAALLAACGYAVVGIVIPIVNGKKGGSLGMEYRTEFGDMNSFMLDSLRGIDETIQYNAGKNRLDEISSRSNKLSAKQKKLSSLEGRQRALTNSVILIFSLGMLCLMMYAKNTGAVTFDQMLINTVAMMGSFGPVVALSNLSNNLNQTLASGERVLSLLEEEPITTDITGCEPTEFDGAAAENVTFGYGDETILDNISVAFPKNKIVGIHGVSGSGKSTLLKLLMRFWDTDKGKVTVSGKNIKEVNTSDLRDMQGYVTQETYLFHRTIAENIEIGKSGASLEEIQEAAKKASIHDFIMSLPNGYDTKLGELGDTLSGGEKQRIGVARAFLHDSPFLLLDEPTSSLDALNEGVILKSVNEAAKEKTVVIVSHRQSTLRCADKIFEMSALRKS